MYIYCVAMGIFKKGMERMTGKEAKSKFEHILASTYCKIWSIL